jgi:hypothetical protein
VVVVIQLACKLPDNQYLSIDIPTGVKSSQLKKPFILEGFYHFGRV